MADSSNWRVRAPADSSAQPQQSNWSSRGSRGNRSSQEDRPHRQPIVPLAERSRAEDVRVHRPEKQQEESPETLQAIAEGRRVYLGNLFYEATPDKIDEFLASNGVGSVTNVHISIDPFTGRCPGYCFIEFEEKKNADEAMEVLEGVLMFGRPVKCRPCRPKGNVRRGGPGQRDRGENSNLGYNRWGNWEKSAASDAQTGRLSELSGPNAALRHYQASNSQKEGRQLYVGGLPRMLDQAENELEIRSIFKDFEIDGVSKRVSPRDRNDNNNRRNFCFVDFATREEAEAARKAIDGMLYSGAPLKVSVGIPRSDRQMSNYPKREETVGRSSPWG
ncbi:hypothetical protein DSL72_005754 [Monilinia vaccinii-corymbosi]|uniref:RRM domain-containing protein n=1 Tax=Monilinia vaccinii-corymbosi TaxID=61207 RepID=A0A8A3PGN1_9HELO|nr:hypothetical protein DSL72_005754 [Monilinia vaccinii-corymbosi]